MKKLVLPIVLLAAMVLQTFAQEKIVNAYGTIPQLLQLNPNTPNNVVAVQGLATAADGQGGIFAYDGSSVTATNTTNTFKPILFDGRWIRQFGGGQIALFGDNVLISTNVTGSPVSGAGGALSLTLNTQTAKTFFAGPISGSAAAPTFITAANAKTALGIQAGTATTAADGTVTNTFSTAFASAPVVVISPFNNTTATNSVVSVSTTAFVANLGTAAAVLHWIAVGAP